MSSKNVVMCNTYVHILKKKKRENSFRFGTSMLNYLLYPYDIEHYLGNRKLDKLKCIPVHPPLTLILACH